MKRFLILLLTLGITIFLSSCAKKPMSYDELLSALEVLSKKYDEVEFFTPTESEYKLKKMEFENIEELEAFIKGVIENMSK